MLSSTLLGPLGVLLTCTSGALAFDDISIASTVEADTEVEVTITNDIADGRDSFDAGFTNFNLYLSTTPPGWGTGPVCLLVNGTKISNTVVKVKIPADVVPEDAELQITSMEWNSDPYKDGPSGFEYSNTFTLQGATGKWGKSELEGEGVGDMDHIPCSAYACARTCSDKYLSERKKNQNDINSYKSTYECIASCPGTTYPSWESVIKQYHDENGDDDSSSSTDSVETTTATATAKASGASKAASTTPTGSSTSVTTSTSSSTEAASTPSETTGDAGQMSVKTIGLALVGIVAVYNLF